MSNYPVRHLTLDLNGASFHVAEAGEGELAILLHGFPECWYSWRHTMDALAPHFTVAAPDCRGFGQSDKGAGLEAYTPAALCGDLLALLRHYGAKSCVLAGHDWGGLLAWHFAALHPECVSRLVILNAPHPNRFQWALDHDPAQRTASQYITRLRDPARESRLDPDALWSITLAANERNGLIDAADKEVYLSGWRIPGAITAMLNWYRAAPFVVPAPDAPYDTSRQDLIGNLRVTAPTLLIWGMLDTILLPVLLDDLGIYVPNLEIISIGDAGHGLLHEQPLASARLIRDFFIGHDPL